VNPCKEGCKTWAFVERGGKCEHGHELPPAMREAELLVNRLMNAHATVIVGEDYTPTEEAENETDFQRLRAEVVDSIAQPLYPRVEVPTEAGWYWRQHRLWEVAPSSARLVFLHGGVVRSVEDVSGPWFGPVPPPEDWK